MNYVETTPVSPRTFPTSTTTTTTTTTTEAPTTPKAIIASPKSTPRMRPVRYGNATRPRFSVKDYKSRMEYKNRLSQSSSTEASTVTASPKQRGHKNHQAPADPNFKEPVGRYKYPSRSSYRTTSTTTPTSHDETSGPTERTSRFTPKKRINTSHYYRSRVSGTTSPAPSQDHTSAQSTARPENVFSSSIRKRPTLKKPGLFDRTNKVAASPVPETQSLAETGFFASTTVASSPGGLTEAANEIGSEHEEAPIEEAPVEEAPKHVVAQVESQDEKSSDLSDVTMDESDDKDKYHSAVDGEEQVHIVEAQRPEEVTEARLDEAQQPTSEASSLDSTTPFDLRHEEELFAKASQSVADLTSSASALYDKPGMFKAVSPAGENRVISAHLKIATDEPTLPIEAFFHEFTRKN